MRIRACTKAERVEKVKEQVRAFFAFLKENNMVWDYMELFKGYNWNNLGYLYSFFDESVKNLNELPIDELLIGMGYVDGAQSFIYKLVLESTDRVTLAVKWDEVDKKWYKTVMKSDLSKNCWLTTLFTGRK